MTTPGDPIEEYLDTLYAGLRVTPREARRVLAEAEDHLREAVAEGVAAGLTEREAQEQAISAFGSVRAVVRAHDTRRFTAAAVLGDLAMSAWALLSAGLLAVGVSGLVAAAMNTVLGRQFVAGAPSATGLSAATCRHYLTIWPAAHSCAQASMLEISSDAVSLRLAAGVTGLLVLAGYLVSRRRWSGRVLPDTFLPTVAVTLFGAAGAGLAWLSARYALLGAGSGPGGTGVYLSGAVVALAVAAAYLWPLRRTLARHLRG